MGDCIPGSPRFQRGSQVGVVTNRHALPIVQPPANIYPLVFSAAARKNYFPTDTRAGDVDGRIATDEPSERGSTGGGGFADDIDPEDALPSPVPFDAINAVDLWNLQVRSLDNCTNAVGLLRKRPRVIEVGKRGGGGLQLVWVISWFFPPA